MNDHDAGARLAAAERAREQVRRNGRWPRWMYIGCAAAGFAYIAIQGLDVPKAVFWTMFSVWIATVAGLTVYAMRQRVVPRSYQAIFPWTVLVWFVAWMTVFLVGAAYFPHNPAWWIPGAAVTSGIMLAGGRLDARAARR